LAALGLIALSLGSYLYHRRQLESIAARHLRLVVAGSGQLQAGAPSVFNLLTTTVTGDPRATQVEWSLTTPDGKRLMDRKETTDSDGRLTMIVPADMDLSRRARGSAQLTVVADGKAGPSLVTLPLQLRPARYRTRLWLDRQSYRPGDTVYFRSLTLSDYNLTPGGTLPLEFEILDPHSAPLAASRLEGLTDLGVGNGSFRLPDALAAGIYALVARGLEDTFPEQRLTFEVTGNAAPHFQGKAKFGRDKYGPGDDVSAEILLQRPDGKPAAGVSLQIAAKSDDQVIFQKIAKTNLDGKSRAEFALPRQLPSGRCQLLFTVEGDRGETILSPIPLHLGNPRVEFYPEGGALVTGLENRVYFAVRDAGALSLKIRGEVLDGKGKAVVRVETGRDGRGLFAITPESSESYRLKIADPPGISKTPFLPPASSDTKIAITTGRGVFAAGAPLVLGIRASKDRIPLVITAHTRGTLVGQQMLVTASSQSQTNVSTLVMPLDDPVAGVVRLTVYDYTKSPPKVLAERFVFRQPRRLMVRATAGKLPADGLWISVDDPQHRPVAAALGVTVLDNKDDGPRLDRRGPDLFHAFLAGGLQDWTALESVDLSPVNREDKAAALELALGCQGPCPANQVSAGGSDAKDLSPPILFDNLIPLRAEYDLALSEYQAKRTHVVNALIMLGFFGGLALALLVTMMALLRIVWGSRLGLPTVVATVCCVVVTAVSNEPSRMKPVESAAVGFATWLPNGDAATRGQDRQPPAQAATARSALQRLADRLSKLEADTEALKSDRFILRQYSVPQGRQDPAGPLAWYPLLVAGPDGRVEVPAAATLAGKPLRLILDVHSDGRLDSCDLLMK
jgi:5-hydroxyisourate hydrolase-like protein (transthyretin family)